MTRRAGVMTNFASLLSIQVLFFTGQAMGWNKILVLAEILLLMVLLSSFYLIYAKTGLWKMVHTKFESLDERQIQVVHNALKFSYSAFAIIVLGCMYYYVIFESGQISVVLVTGLLYLAHVLPASIIAWNEREI